MKTTLFALCLLCAASALGQSGGAPLNSSIHFSNHSDQAGPASMAQEQSLWVGSSIVSAQGERPVGEVVPEKYEMPLGDAARIQRKEHATVKKAQVVWENRAWGPGLSQSPAR